MSNNTTDHINEVMNSSVAESATVASVNELHSKINLNDHTSYIIADAFTGNPYQLLGQVVEVRKSGGKCPDALINQQDLNFEFSPVPVIGFKIDGQSKLEKAILRSSIVVDKNLAAQSSFLNYLSAQLDAKSAFSLMIIDQAKGLVDFQDPSWKDAINTWKTENADKLQDPEICYIYVVTGFVQKNIIKKKYYQFEAGVKGGAYAINIQGKLSTSTDEYSLDIIFGLTPAIIKRPLPIRSISAEFLPTASESKLFALTSGKEFKR